MKQPIVLYRGPSVLDGAPIVCIATLGSSNVKTGPMVQTWIMRADVNPLQASADASDDSVCGDCPRRHSTGGDCYVTLIQAPRAVWANWDKAGRPRANWKAPKTTDKLRTAAQTTGFRMGSYGDPAAVPWRVWATVMERLQPRLWTGYTHQWRRTPGWEGHAWFQSHIMASVDSPEEALVARAAGWRYFMAVTPDRLDALPARTILCLADREGDKARTCEQCGICNGTQGKAVPAVSVYLIEHGGRSSAKHKRALTAKTSSLLKVVQ